jgi:carbonic anhydrase/acetyltransferase-like protein (isoleucine patch superfamily)
MNVDPTAWIHPSAVLMGDVTLSARVSVWPTVVLRGDQGEIVVGEDSNLQDGTIAHATGGFSTVRVGARVTVGHRVILHGCQVGDDVLVGMGSILLDNCVIEPWCLIAAGALVPVGARIPSGSVVMGNPGRVVRQFTDRDRAMIEGGVAAYRMLAERWAAEGVGGPR